MAHASSDCASRTSRRRSEICAGRKKAVCSSLYSLLSALFPMVRNVGSRRVPRGQRIKRRLHLLQLPNEEDSAWKEGDGNTAEIRRFIAFSPLMGPF
eukprot:3258619-Rhodomonas_salina.1